MKQQYAYSNDKEFLSKIDALRIKEQWVKITLLEYDSEIPLKSIEGEITSGSLTKTGDSAVRRTCSLTCAVDAFKYKVDDIKASYSISKKIYLELGITNDTSDYPDEKIIWFPQGVFFITSFAITASAMGAASISLQFKDKMAQLDGTVGGVLPATVRFDTITTIVDGVPHTDKALVYDIIMETVNHFGGESLSNIIIDDIPTKAKRIIRWLGTEPIWIYPIIGKNNEISYNICFASDLDEKQTAHTPINYNGQIISAKEYKVNQDIGYMYEDFVYDDELTFNAGAKVTDVLDKIKQWLGNYEYFYDEYGQFHFQEIKNYLNNRESSDIWNKIVRTDDSDYLYESTRGGVTYTFDDNINLISITNTPVYENIKNDFIVEGTVTKDGSKRTCRYHLVIDDKPTITTEGYNNVLVYTDPTSGDTTIAQPKLITPTKVGEKWVWSLPEFAEDGAIYAILDEPQTFTFKKSLKDMNDFATSYNALVDTENALINQDKNHLLTQEMEDYFFALLETYMGYTDTTPYKEEYRDTIFTLARLLRQYNVNKRQSSLSTTVEYYEDLYLQYSSDIADYGKNVSSKISWCGCLLQLLYDLFDDINSTHTPFKGYIDASYWPPVDIILKDLWADITVSTDVDAMRQTRKNRCLTYANEATIKHKELSILIEQCTQIINNYNIQLNSYRRSGAADSTINTLIAAIDDVQERLNNYEAELNSCSERLNVLYAVLTVLGAPNSSIGETYYTVDINIPVRASSFWYYSNDSTQDTYGWKELTWYQYYCDKTDPTDYYPDGLGSMTYIDYSKIRWNDANFTQENCPSMNRYSSWYQNYYIDYAKEYGLSYFDTDKIDSYIPTNWRTELLLRGIRAEANGIDPGQYYQELKLNWPTIYDLKTGQLIPTSINYIDYFVGKTGVIFGDTYNFSDYESNTSANVDNPEGSNARAAFKPDEEAEIQNMILNYEDGNYYYFFDMIDSSSPTWGEYSVKNIGRRTNVNVSEGVNCIFEPHIPDYAFINVSGLTTQERKEKYAELADIAETIIQVTDAFHKNFATGGFKHSAYEQIRYDLQQHTSYQNTLSITAIPCFYLEPNTRVKLNDHSTNTFGDYVVKSISIPLGLGGNMSVSLSKAMQRI